VCRRGQPRQREIDNVWCVMSNTMKFAEWFKIELIVSIVSMAINAH
jgi:hypothetical protein